MAELDDLKAHEEMWHNFTKLTIYGSVAVIVALILMAIFLI